MSIGARRVRALAAVLAAAVAALVAVETAAARPRDLTTDRGVVQSATAAQIVLRELDGSAIVLPVDGRTRVFLNGRPAQLTDIQPGFVAAVLHEGTSPARAVRAFGRIATTVDRGIVVAVAPGLLALRRGDGSVVTVRLTSATRLRWRGVPVSAEAIRPGRPARIVYVPNGAARLVEIFGRRP